MIALRSERNPVMGARIPSTASSTPSDARKYERPAITSMIVLMGAAATLSTMLRIPPRRASTQSTAVASAFVTAMSSPRARPRGTITLAQPLPPLSLRSSMRIVRFSPLKRNSRTLLKGATISRRISTKRASLASALAASARPHCLSITTLVGCLSSSILAVTL